MRPSRGVLGWLPWWLTACVASHTEAPTAAWPAALRPGAERPAVDRLLTRGDIHIVEEHLQAFGVDPGPIDGLLTTQTQAAVRAFQARYGFQVSGLLDYPTRLQLLPGLDFDKEDP
jgi:peptidoglycan hydrolase-like protein with peptidoglycan-binding domain